MAFRRVTATIPSLGLGNVVEALTRAGVPGMTVLKARGFGEHRKSSAKDSMSDCVCLEGHTDAYKANENVREIVRTSHRGMSSDGMVAVLPEEELIHIRELEESQHDGRK